MFSKKVKLLFTKKTNTSNTLLKLIPMSQHINNILYSEEAEGYYSSKNKFPIGRLSKPINIKNIYNAVDYERELSLLYPNSSWVTTSETLYPLYGYVIAYFMTRQFSLFLANNKIKEGSSFNIIEVGCGMGGLADSIIDFYKKYDIKLYKSLEYICIDSNKYFIDSTSELINSKAQQKQVSFINNSIFNLDTRVKLEDPCFILMFNFLNSLPHIRLKLTNHKKLKTIIEDSINNVLNCNNINDKINESLPNFIQNSQQIYSTNNEFIIFLSYFAYSLLRDKNVIEISFVNLETNKEEFYDISNILDINISNVNHASSIEFISNLLRVISTYYFPNELFNNFKYRNEDKDDWVIKIIKYTQKFYCKEYLWLTMISEALIFKLNTVFPNANYLINDYDFLFVEKKSQYKGINMPSAYSIIKDSNDYYNYNDIINTNVKEKHKLLPMNVYFPINFDFMRKQLSLITGKQFIIEKHSKIMKDNILEEWDLSKKGYNALTDTHLNTSFIYSI